MLCILRAGRTIQPRGLIAASRTLGGFKDIPTNAARVFTPLLEPARYKGAWGGRGSGKSHFFGERVVHPLFERAGPARGLHPRGAEDAGAVVKAADRAEDCRARRRARVQGHRGRIITPGGGVIIFQGMQDHTAEIIKSLEGFKIAWIEEAQTLSQRSLALLRPTIRTSGSEIWASWNPRRKSDAIDEFLRQKQPDGAVVVEANWRDNPWFHGRAEGRARGST